MIGVCPTAGGVRHHQGETAGSEAVAVAVAAVEAAVAVKARAACASERRKVEGSRDKNPGVRWAATAGRAAFSPGPPGPPMHIISQTRHGQHTMSHSSGTQQGQNPRKPGPPGPPWKPCAPLPMVHLRDERRAREWSRRALPRAAVVRASTFWARCAGPARRRCAGNTTVSGPKSWHLARFLWPCLPAREAARQLHESASNFAGARPAPRRSAVTHETDRTAHVLLSTAGHYHHGRRPGRLLQAARRAEECDEQRDPPGIPSEGAREPPRPRGRARALPDDQQGRFALSRPFLCEVLVVPLTRQRR